LPKIAKFWRMEAHGKPRKLMRDVQSVRWLPLKKAIEKLSKPREQKFLREVGPSVLRAAAIETPATRTSAGLLQRLLKYLGLR
jgi:8-oxo-dGTP diphosphatase